MSELAVGIDLGIINSRVCAYINGNSDIVEGARGQKFIASFLYFKPKGIKENIIIGVRAKTMASRKPENGIYGFKSLIGKRFDDPQVQKKKPYFPFTIAADVSNSIVITFTQNGITVTKTPQQLLSIFLSKLKIHSEKYFQQRITKVVITVPAYFNVIQRKATLTAAEDAGFTVSNILSEPTTTVLSYYFRQPVSHSSLTLVYGMGAGSFEVSVLRTHGTFVTMLATTGETELSGQDFDDCIMDIIIEVLKNEYDYDVADDFDVKRKIRRHCSEAKKKLSGLPRTVVLLTQIVPGHAEVQIVITKAQFEQKSEPLFEKLIDIVNIFLVNSNVPKTSITKIVLCGGSSRIPNIREKIREFFGRRLDTYITSVEGAGFKAAMSSEHIHQKAQIFQATDVVPLSIGFHCFGGKMIYLIKRNTKIPYKNSTVFRNTHDHQRRMLVDIFEGERPDYRLNRHLGTLVIKNLTPGPTHTIAVEATLCIGYNGTLFATAHETASNRYLTVYFEASEHSDRGIQNSLADAIRNITNDNRFKRFLNFKMLVLNYCLRVLCNLEQLGLTDRYEKAYNCCKETIKAIATYVEMDQEYNVKKLMERCYEVVQGMIL